MAPLITLYILGGCVAAAVLLFILMIVLSALRPPQLPEMSFDAPPLERMMRALTPVPVAPPVSEEAPTTRAASPVIARTAAPAPAAVSRPSPRPPVALPGVPTHTPQSPPASSFGASPFVWPAPHSAPAAAPATKPLAPATRVRPDLPYSPIRPLYPARRSRKLSRVVIALFALTTLAAGTVVAYPSVLDPLVDDYEWFGADAAAGVRDHARNAHAAISDLVHGQ